VIHASGSDDLPLDERDDAAVRLAFDAWGTVPTSSLRFVENTGLRNVPKQHQNDGVNLVFFDENNASGFFGSASFVIALTPVFYGASGNLIDADIIFNGRDHRFSTDLAAGTYDIQNIATHEIGHFAGFDHTGVYGATLVPFAFYAETRLRSLSRDDRAALETVYPASGAASGQILGRVLFEGGSTGVDGAHVVATDAVSGEPVSTTISEANGDFAIRGLPAGSYRLYAEPLDGPTSQANIQRGGIDAAFSTVFFGGVAAPQTLSVPAGGTIDLRGQPLRVAPRTGFNIDGIAGGPAQVQRGRTATIQLTGAGLASGLDVEVPGPGVRLSLDANRGRLSSQGAFTITVDPNAPAGLRDIYVYRGSGAAREMVALPGGLEVRAAPPTVLGAFPGSGPASGGDAVTISGTDFAPGARVLFGDQIAPQVQFLSETALACTTPAHGVGSVAVTVINADGQQGTRAGTYSFTGRPRITGLAPSSGPTSGGVPVAILGSQFGAGAIVRFDGARATSVVVTDQGRRIECVTPAGTLGPADVSVENPDGGSDAIVGAYEYAAPRLDAVSPSVGSSAGGTLVSLTGDAFGPGMRVEFGAGRATSVQFVSQTEIRAITPPGQAGTVDVTVIAPDGLSDSIRGGFRYIVGVDPVVTGVTPDRGPVGGGTPIVIFGSSFETGAQVHVGGTPATGVLVVSPSEIRAVTPPGQAGPRDVTVTNPTGLVGTRFGGFTYEVAGGSSREKGGGGGGGGCAAGGPRAGSAAGLAPYLLLLGGLGIIRRRVRVRLAIETARGIRG
jgi:hypothetical protein